MNNLQRPQQHLEAVRRARRLRRTIYALTKRSLMVPMFEVLDLCDTTRTAAQRQVTSVAPQALTLFNGQFVNRQAKALAERLAQDAGPDPATQIHHVWLLALSREPRPTELAKLLNFLAAETPRIAFEEQIRSPLARSNKPACGKLSDSRLLARRCHHADDDAGDPGGTGRTLPRSGHHAAAVLARVAYRRRYEFRSLYAAALHSRFILGGSATGHAP